MMSEQAPRVWSLGKRRLGEQTLTEHRADCGVVLRSRAAPFTTVFIYDRAPTREQLGPGNTWHVAHNCVR